MRHRPFDGIHQQQDTVNHRQDTFHLATEIGMPRRIDNIDMRSLIFHGTVFGENGDPAFLFQIIGIHHPFTDGLIFTESSGLTQQLIDQCGFAVIDVRDNRDVADSAFGFRHKNSRN